MFKKLGLNIDIWSIEQAGKKKTDAGWAPNAGIQVNRQASQGDH